MSIKRCAIYTRKSHEEGLEQDFNSLHAQCEACESFIKSQKHEGWQVLQAAYDDGGISGGTMERPALRQLLTVSLEPLIPQDAKTPASVTQDFPMQLKRRGVEIRLVVDNTPAARIDDTLVQSIVRAHKWYNALASGQAQSVAEIAAQEGVDKSYVNRILSLANLAPSITEMIIAGQQPATFSVEMLTKHIDLPLDWAEQQRILGCH